MSGSMDSEFYIETDLYKGNEEKVLEIRNRNRNNNVTQEYLNWRYLGHQSNKPPIVFFVKSKAQSIVGMASIIYRVYSIYGQKFEVPVLGDISLDEDLRGTGVAKKLFNEINKYLGQDNAPFAFVLPNIAARKSLVKADWKTEQNLVRYVFFLNPKGALRNVKNKICKTLAGFTSELVSRLIKIFLYLNQCNNIEMRSIQSFSKAFDKLWVNIPKKKWITKERISEYLRWRYLEHPHDAFQVFEFYGKNEFIGYIVAKYAKKEKTFSIYELFAKDEKYLKSVIRKFLYQCTCMDKIDSVRITLNQKNPYSKILQKAFFIQRPTDNVFQIKYLKQDFDEPDWLITTGDKDV